MSRWSSSEITVIQEGYGSMDINGMIAQLPGRSKQSVYRMAYRMKIGNRRQNYTYRRPRTPAQKAIGEAFNNWRGAQPGQLQGRAW